MTVAVAASLTDLPHSLALFLGMDDAPDAPMRHHHPPPYTPRTTTPPTSYVPQMLHTLTSPTHIPRTSNDPLNQQFLPKTMFDTNIPPNQPSTSFQAHPVASLPPSSSSWEGVSSDPTFTSSFDLYGSPGFPIPSPHPAPVPMVTTYLSHTERISHNVNVTLAELTLASSQTVQTQSDYCSAYPEAEYYSVSSPSLAQLVGEDQQVSSDWSTISGATMGLEGWGGDPFPPWPTLVTNVTAPSDPAATSMWHTQPSEEDNVLYLQGSPVCSLHPEEAALSPTSKEVSQGFLHGNGAPHGRRSTSRSPLSPTGAVSTPSPQGDIPPSSPLAPSGSSHMYSADRSRWRRRHQHQQQRSQQKVEEEGVWWGSGSGRRRWSGQPRRSHSLVPMESAGGALPVESGAPSPTKCSSPGDHTPHTPEQHTSRDEGQDDDEDDNDTESSRVCVPPGKSLQFEQFEMRAQNLL